MSTARMAAEARFSYLRQMQDRYHKAGRHGKSKLLDEMHTVTELHRKHLIACMANPDLARHERNRERDRTYGADVERVVALVADTLDWIGADRLQPCLVAIAQDLERFGHLSLPSSVLDKLQRISVSTVRRMLRRIGRPTNAPPQVRRGRRPDSVVQAAVPVSVIPWDEPEPGHFEADLVVHGPPGLEGPVVHSLQLVDVLTGWSERFSILGREFSEVWQAIQAFRERCPIPVHEIHTDNGSEFMNRALVSQLGAEALRIRLTRGRAGARNDNRFVEQKNSSLVRAYLGNLCLFTTTHRALLGQLYEDMGLYYNLFQPVVRQTSRHVQAGNNGLIRIVRTQDQAATPLERLLRAKPPLSRSVAESLLQLRHDTDPLKLKRSIHTQLTELALLARRDAERVGISFR